MTGRTVTRADLAAAVERRIGFSRSDSQRLVNVVLAAVAAEIQDGNMVRIAGFGTFRTSYRPARSGRDPKTGNQTTMPPVHVIHFRPSSTLRRTVNGSAD